jgi:hypothetical protein
VSTNRATRTIWKEWCRQRSLSRLKSYFQLEFAVLTDLVMNVITCCTLVSSSADFRPGWWKWSFLRNVVSHTDYTGCISEVGNFNSILNYAWIFLEALTNAKNKSGHLTEILTRHLWPSGFYPSLGVLNTRKHNVSETGSLSVLGWAEGIYMLGRIQFPKFFSVVFGIPDDEQSSEIPLFWILFTLVKTFQILH